MTSSAARFSDALPFVVDAPGGIDSARQAVLSLAVAGCLVPQFSREGRGHDVLAKIGLQRDGQDIQGRSLNRKRDKTASDDQAADPSFEIPGNWCWARLGEIAVKLGAGSTPLGGKSVYKRSGIKFLRSQNVWDSGLRLDDVAFIDAETHQRMEGTHVRPGDLLLNITGASIGRCAVVPDDFDEGNVSQHVAIVRLVDRDLRAFAHLCLISPYFQALIMGVQVGVSREGLSMKRLQDLQVPIPPVMEQKRIVAKVDQLMALSDDLEARQTKKRDLATQSTRSALTALTTAETADDLSAAWCRIDGDFGLLFAGPDGSSDLRTAILDLAVSGRLAWDNSDVDDIRSGSSTRGSASSIQNPPGEDEGAILPFSLPAGWTVAPLGKVAEKLTDGEHIQPKTVPQGFLMLSAKHVTNAGVSVNEPKYVSVEDAARFRQRCDPRAGDLLIVGRGSVGKCCVVQAGLPMFALMGSVILVRPPRFLRSEFLLMLLRSTYGQRCMVGLTRTMAQPALYLRDLKTLGVPIPPLAEQKRIVAKVDHLMSLLDDLETKLRKQEETATRLAESLAAAVAN